MAKCEICGKAPQFGNNVPFSLHRTKRRWKPNVQKMTVEINGQRKTVKICTRCLRTMNKV